MASVIRRLRRTRVKLEHGYDVGAWRRHGSMHPDAMRRRARHPLVNPDEYPARVESYPVKAELFDAPQPEGPRDASDLVGAYPIRFM